MAFTDDELYNLAVALDDAIADVQQVPASDVRKLLDRLKSAEKVCRLSQIEQASHMCEGMGWQSTEDVYNALIEWRTASGK